MVELENVKLKNVKLKDEKVNKALVDGARGDVCGILGQREAEHYRPPRRYVDALQGRALGLTVDPRFQCSTWALSAGEVVVGLRDKTVWTKWLGLS